ncbi:MAG: hypothetical protein J0I77_13985 [Rudaea sp.]|uniref:hypothetical protein n=1 Tax=Rudaea sp. TaxID=2136325 RepID=UPI0014855807|nr:hypothetical protein [Rudaea sp.]MBN8886825.1 hypothetical protein [Rudaea sp.]
MSEAICDLPDCKKRLNMGHGVWEGRWLPTYQMTICTVHINASPEGWAPHREEFLLSWLQSKNLPVPKRNANGLLPFFA